jgi:phosphopantothenoylcysteine decarboxylase
MPKIVLGVTGSVAAIRTPLLYRELTLRGHEVRIVLTEHATYFFNPDAVPGALVFRDSDEWPKTKTGELYQPGDPVLHIELRRWAELLLVAPLDAHTLAKFALGLCDNLLTCLYEPGTDADQFCLHRHEYPHVGTSSNTSSSTTAPGRPHFVSTA